MNAIAHMTAQVLASTYHPSRHHGMPVKPCLRDQILQARAEGMTYDKIVKLLHVSRDTISKVINAGGAAS